MKKKILIVVSIIISGAVAYFIYKFIKSRRGDDSVPSGSTSGSGSTGSGSTGSGSTGSTRYKSDDFPLKLYSGGERVKNVQRWINWTGKRSKVVVDGKWGPKTEAAMHGWSAYTDDQQVDQAEYNGMMKALNSGYANYDDYATANGLYHS